MTNPSKARGTAYETALVGWLQTHGHPYAERRTLAGAHDRGDIAGIPGVVLEAKNCKTIALAAWVDELAVEIGNAGVDIGAVVIRRRGTSDVGRSYAVMPLDVFNRLIAGEPT